MDVSLDDIKEFEKPVWQQEGWASYDDYEKYYVAVVEDLAKEAKNGWRNVKDRWMEVDKRIEMTGPAARQPVSKSDTAFVPQAIEEAVALNCETMPRPKTASRSPDTQEMSGQINGAMEQEFDANEFESLVMPKTVYNAYKFFVGVQKITWDPDESGQFGNTGRNVIVNIDPRYVHPDPFAKGYRRNQMRYLVVEEPMDCSEARRRWPDKEIEAEGKYSISRRAGASESTDALLMSGGDGEYTVSVRHRVVVKECWLNTDKTKEEPQKDADGNVIRDADGKIVTKTVKAYPYGRLLIVANGTLLVDMANPYWHGEFPYIFYPCGLRDKILSYGPAEPMLRIAEKMNQLDKDMMSNLRVAMNSPWVIDRHAFDTPKKFNMLTREPGLILPVATGARVERLQAGELPQSVFVFIDHLKKIFDDVVGVSGINRGDLQKGAQLAADAVSQLQQASLARMRMQARRTETGLKFLGHLMQWNIRQFYDSDFQVAMQKPGSEDKVLVGWSVPEAHKGEYSFNIEVGSSLPGSKEAGSALIMTLFEKGLLPRDWALRLMEMPGAEKIIEDIKKRENEFIQLAASVDKDGTKEVMQRRYRAGAGRREASVTL